MNTYGKSVLCLMAFILYAISPEPGFAVDQGQPMGEPFIGVQAYSNGSQTETPNGPLAYQCVDLARDFSNKYHGGFGPVGNAANMWDLLPQSNGYQAIANGSSPVPPQVGDLVVWSGGSDGHVGVVSARLQNEVEIFEQNISADNPYRTTALTTNASGMWELASGISNYTVRGWLRYPSPQNWPYTIVGTRIDGRTNRAIMTSYEVYGGQNTFGSPVSRTIYGQSRPSTVWGWELCLTQVYDGGALGECAILYDQWVNGSKAFPMHGQLWSYYKANNGPYLLLAGTRIGGPVAPEQYATDNATGHLLVVQEMANGLLTYDTVTGFHDATSGSGGFVA